MTLVAFLLDLTAAIGIGALVGLEREHRRRTTDVYAGVRTFPLISTSGYLTVLVANTLSEPLILGVGLLIAGLAALAFFLGRAQQEDLGFTTPMAILVTFLAGALVGLGLLLEAVSVAVATTFLLLTKERLHRLAETLENDEIMGALQFVALAFIAIPLAQAADGPFLRGLVGDGRPVDPAWTLYVVVAASALAFISFIAIRQLGQRHGFPLVGALGGLVNSTATTVGAASIAKGTRGLDNAASAAVLASTGTALVRNVVLVGVADPSFQLLPSFALVLIAPLIVIGASTWIVARRAGGADTPDDLGLKSPFAIRPALAFALVFSAVNALVFYGQGAFGSWGLYATSLGALVSSGAVVASAANLVFIGTISPEAGLILAGLGVAVSSLEKIGVLVVTNRSLIGHVVIPIVAAVAALGIGLIAL